MAAALGSLDAQADPCQPDGDYSPCIDSNSLWLNPGATAFVSVGAARAVARGEMSTLLAAGYQSRPLTAQASSPDPDGRQVRLTDHVVDADVALAFGLAPTLQLDVALPFVGYQNGAGIGGLSAQQSAPLPSAAARDPRTGLLWTFVSTETFAAAGRLVLSLPFGDEQAFAGGASAGLTPGASAELGLGRVTLGASVEARLREPVQLGATRYGHQLRAAFGVSAELARRWLGLAAEANISPLLGDQSSVTSSGTERDATQLPAEWLVSVSTSPAAGVTLQLGGGGGLPVSSERVTRAGEPESETSFVGAGAPRFRFVLLARFATGS